MARATLTRPKVTTTRGRRRYQRRRTPIVLPYVEDLPRYPPARLRTRWKVIYRLHGALRQQMEEMERELPGLVRKGVVGKLGRGLRDEQVRERVHFLAGWSDGSGMPWLVAAAKRLHETADRLCNKEEAPMPPPRPTPTRGKVVQLNPTPYGGQKL